MTTVYEHDGKELFKDETDAYEIEDIRTHYAQFDKRLLTATYTVIPPENEGDPRKVVFAKKTGTKGGGWPDWIRVEDRLPDEGVLVLVVGPQIGVSVGDWVKTEDGIVQWATLDENRIFDDIKPCGVTHWMPLPAGPEAR